MPAPSAGGWPEDEDRSADAPLPPTRPQRSSPVGRPSGLQVAADGRYDRHELERFAASRLPGVPPTTIRDVLDVYDEHLIVRGIADAGDEPLRFYDREAPPPGDVVDGAEIAADAARFLAIEAATAERVLDVEHDYLEAKGLLG